MAFCGGFGRFGARRRRRRRSYELLVHALCQLWPGVQCRLRPSVSRTALRLLEFDCWRGQRLDGLRVERVADGHVLAREGLARAVLDLGDERHVVVVVGRFCVPLCVMVCRCLILGCRGSLRCLFEFGGVVDVIVVRLLVAAS